MLSSAGHNYYLNNDTSSHYRFSYAVVDDEEDEYEPEQGPNENFGELIVCGVIIAGEILKVYALSLHPFHDIFLLNF